MIRFKITFRIIICAWLFTGIWSCSKWDSLEWDVGISAPLIKTSLDLNDIIPDTFRAADCINNAYIDYRQKVFELTQDTLFNFSQSITDLAYSIPLTINLNPGQVFISTIEESTFSFMDAEIRSMIVDKGIVNITFTNPLKEKVVCTYSIPQSLKNGKYFSARATVPPAVGNQPGILNIDADISGYNIDLTGTSGMGHNKIRVKIDAFVDSVGQQVQITPFDTLKINASFEEFKLLYAEGYFGRHEISTGTKSTKLKIFDLFEDGNIILDTAIAVLKISNGLGADLRLKINEIKVENKKNSTSASLSDPFIGVPVNVIRAQKNQSTGQITPTEHDFYFNPVTTKKMFELFPDELFYDLDVEINPMGNISLGNDFMHKNHPLTAWFELLIPMNIMVQGLTLKQDVDFYFESSTINNGTLYLIADNGFPFDATITLHLKDEKGNVIDSLQPAGTIQAGKYLISDYMEPVRTIIPVHCDAARLSLLKQTRSMTLEVVLNTMPAGTFVRLKSDYNMEIVISTNMNTKLTP